MFRLNDVDCKKLMKFEKRRGVKELNTICQRWKLKVDAKK